MEFYAQQTAASNQRHPFDLGLGYLVTYHDIQKNELRQEVEYLNTKEEHDEDRFIVEWYVNGEKTFVVNSIRANGIYDLAVPGEALLPLDNNRWHVMMRQAALQKIQALQPDESLTIAFQDPHVNPEYDVERIVVKRNPYPELWYE